MSVILRPRTTSPGLRRLANPAWTVRSVAAALAAGATVMALVLATVSPSYADQKDGLARALIAALVIGAIAQELTDQDAGTDKPTRKERLPAACAISIDGDGQALTLYSENCLRSEGFKRSLPRTCASRATIFGERDKVYSAKCLRKAGYRVLGY